MIITVRAFNFIVIVEEVKNDNLRQSEMGKKPSFDHELYIRQMQDLRNYETCKQCKKPFTLKEEQEQQKVMLLSTDCYHLVHKFCFKELCFK